MEPRVPIQDLPSEQDDLSSFRLRIDSKTTGPTARAASPLAKVATGYSGYGAPADIAFSTEVHLLDYLKVLHKRRWTALTAFLVVFGSVVLYTFTAIPIYRATTQILIENENPNVVKFDEVYDERKETNDYYQTQYRILQSRALAYRTLEAEKLFDDPVMQQPTAVSLNPLVWIARVPSVVRGWFVTKPVPEPPLPGETAARSRAVDRFFGGLQVAPIRNSRLVEVHYNSPNPELAQRLANAVAAQYIQQNLEFKFLATQEATEFLMQRMNEQRKSLDQSEQALQRYREETGAIALVDRQNIVVQRLSDLNSAVTRARTDRIEKEALYNEVRLLQSEPSKLDTFPAILNNTFIQQLKGQLSDLQRQAAELSEKLGELHPGMVKVKSAIESTENRLAAEIQKVVQALRIDYEAALSNERGLQSSLDQQRGEAQRLNRMAIEYGVLERDSASNRSMFEGLLQRSKETGVAGELKTSNIRIVDRAELPRSPIFPRKTTNTFAGMIGGLLLGMGLAFFFEYLDSRIKSPEEVRDRLGLPFLGLIPAIDEKAMTGPPLLNSQVPQHFSEAFRAIRTNVLFSSAEEGCKSLVVTSTGPGDGKTVVTANLAISLAMSGQRVLLIDADMRRPKAHEMFSIKQEPGLSNLMVGTVKASDVVRKLPSPNLWILPAGKHPPNPAELLGSRRFREFLASLNDHFDWVIIDSPPVMAVTDASVLAHFATGVIFVVRAEATGKGAAKAALAQLDAVKARFLGGILNRVDLRRNSYYYAHYYRKEYAQYYTKAAK